MTILKALAKHYGRITSTGVPGGVGAGLGGTGTGAGAGGQWFSIM